MGNVFCFDWEITLMQWIQQLGNFGDSLATSMTMLGEDLVMIGILGMIYWGINKYWARQTFTTFVMAALSGAMIKNVVLRRRPYMDHKEIRCPRLADPSADPLDISKQGFSCPSLHAANTTSIFGTLAAQAKKRWFTILTSILLVMVGCSRVMLGVHYPTDVLLGWALGISAMVLSAWMTRRIRNPLIHMAIIGLAALPGWFFCISDEFYTVYGLVLGVYLGFWLDDRFIHFKNTRSIPLMVIRTLLGLGVFLATSALLKLPFPEELLEAVDLTGHLVRTFRYAACSFLTLGVYPVVFPFIDRIMPAAKEQPSAQV